MGPKTSLVGVSAGRRNQFCEAEITQQLGAKQSLRLEIP